jgi:hypothetical protein
VFAVSAPGGVELDQDEGKLIDGFLEVGVVELQHVIFGGESLLIFFSLSLGAESKEEHDKNPGQSFGSHCESI